MFGQIPIISIAIKLGHFILFFEIKIKNSILWVNQIIFHTGYVTIKESIPFVMVSDCQFASIWNNLEDKAPGSSVRDYLD